MIGSYKVKPLSKEKITLIMERYLADHFPNHLKAPGALDVEELLDQKLFLSHGYRLCLSEDKNEDVEAQMIPTEEVIEFPTKNWNKVIQGDYRQRFTSGHEGSHVILGHGQQINENTISFSRSYHKDLKSYENSEWQADFGAGCLLMPRKTLVPFVTKLFKRGYTSRMIIEAVSDIYQVSFTAAKLRIKKEDSMIWQIKESFKKVD